MIAELGHFALALALCVALAQAALALAGATLERPAWIAFARPAAAAQFACVALAYAALTWAFVECDFSVLAVAQHANKALPLTYRIAAVWGGHEGSILLWSLMLALWGVAVALWCRGLPERVVARILGVMALVSVGLLAFTLFTSNPFERLLPAPEDGRDLNPLLQDPGMALHPPLLYMGYVGFSVAFAFAVAALLAGRLDAAWARWTRPWVTMAWSFLTLGIALGAGWAYYELGWGGWWFWDPVENASFMPWLAGTALMHSLAVTERRGAFRMWTVLLAILTFSLSLLGTFLVRSGVLSSVHAFATDPARGSFILLFLALVIGGSLTLFAWRAPAMAGGGSFSVVSRESMLLVNNVLLLVAAGAVLLGTLYPLAIDALGLGKLSVGPPYFEAVFVPLIAPALFLMGVGPVARWREAPVIELALRLRWAAAVSAVAALGAPWLLGSWTPMAGLGLLLAAWIACTSLHGVWERLSGHPLSRWPRKLAQQPRAFWGMLLAHAGLAVFIVGVTLVKGYETEQDVRMRAGDTAVVAGYAFRFEGVRDLAGPNYKGVQARLSVTHEGRPVALLHPEKRLYANGGMPMTEAAIDSGFTRDLFVALGEPLEDGAWAVRLYHKPFIGWIWGGCALLALGGVLAALDRRYRLARAAQPRRAATAVLPEVVQ